MMYRRMGPKELGKEIEKLKKLKEQQLSKQDFEKAKNALKDAHIPGPYKAIVSPDVDSL